MPNVTQTEVNKGKKGRNEYISKCIHTVKKENPNKPLNAIIGQCEGMWKARWHAKSAKAHFNEEKDYPQWEEESHGDYWVIDFFENQKENK